MSSTDISNQILSGKDSDGKQIILMEWEACAIRLAHAVVAEGWISVGDRLPDHNSAVLAYCPFSREKVRQALFTRNNAGVFHTGGDPVTKWKPLPEPPKEQP